MTGILQTMIDSDGLNVWYEDQLVGYLWRNQVNYIGFRYEAQWLSANGFAVSQCLPLRSEEYSPESGVAHRYFANLLPEGGAREQIVRDLQITNTEFSLLRAIGGECAGAISILAVESSPDQSNRYRTINPEELKILVARKGYGYSNHGNAERPRLSLAGAQNKCAVLIADENYYHPIGNAPSTHILKFESSDYRHLPAYEVFTSMLAANAGLPVIEATLEKNAQRAFVRVTRYDRIVKDPAPDAEGPNLHIQRIHQEDFCQALGFGHDKKYQTDGGPSFAECYQLLSDISTEPAIDTRELLRWLIFNVLAGNSDGHAKNISLIYEREPNGIHSTTRLAPFYDLVCTRAIDRIDSRLAFDIAGQRIPENVRADHWKALAKQCDVGGRYLKSLVTDLADHLPEAFITTKKQFEDRYGSYPQLQRVEKVLIQQCKNARK